MSQLRNCSVMCTKNGSYCENEKKKREKVREEVGCVQRMEVIVKRKKSWGGGGGGGGGQDGCELRSEAFVKIQKKKKLGGGGSGRGWGVGLVGSGWM